MASKTDICNMALAHLNSSGIGSIDEKSAEARACATFYDIALDTTLAAYPWPFATYRATMDLLGQNPTTEWGYSYSMPSDSVALRRIYSGIRNDSRTSRVAYRIVTTGSASAIYTDSDDAVIEYTKRVTDTTKFSADFTLCLSYFLASLIAPKVTGGDPFKLGQQAEAHYRAWLSHAAANAFNAEQAEVEVESESIRSRES